MKDTNGKKSVKDKIIEQLIGEELDLRQKLVNIILLILSLWGAISAVTAFITYDSVTAAAANAVSVGMIFVMFWFSAVKRALPIPLVVVMVIANIITFPIMFSYNGGVNSIMMGWYTMGVVFPWIIVKGKGSYIMFAADAGAAFISIWIEFNHPEMFSRPLNYFSVMFDMVFSLVMVTLIMGCTFKYQAYIFEKQQAEIAAKDKVLMQAVDDLTHEGSAKSAFLAQMSHEIRTPINAVLGMDEMILRESSDPAVLQYADNIRTAGQSLLSIINDILDFSKIESGKLEIVPVNYRLDDLTDYCCKLMEIKAREKNLEFRVSIAGNIPRILFGDEIRIRQIYINLLSNAVKYTSNGHVEFRLTCEEKGGDDVDLICEVSDTGKGISEESIATLFDSFVRVDIKDNRNIEGTGLGLAITRQLTELMDGKISVSSRKGEGSVFKVVIPQKAALITVEEIQSMAAFAAATELQNSHRFHAPSARVLAVDDVKLNIDVFKGLLKASSVQIDVAYSGIECLGLMSSNTYDIVFMDHQMPEMDGVETLKRARKQAEETGVNKDVPVIALTANAMSGAYEEYLSYGFSDYLSKPIKGYELEEMLLKYLPKGLVIYSEEKTAPKGSGGSTGLEEFSAAGLDTEEGLVYCCGDTALYRQVLRLYCDNSKTEELEKYFARCDWKNYVICIYSIKSDSENIGAKKLVHQAGLFEAAVHSGDTDFVMTGHRAFVQDYELTVKKISGLLGI